MIRIDVSSSSSKRLEGGNSTKNGGRGPSQSKNEIVFLKPTDAEQVEVVYKETSSGKVQLYAQPGLYKKLRTVELNNLGFEDALQDVKGVIEDSSRSNFRKGKQQQSQSCSTIKADECAKVVQELEEIGLSKLCDIDDSFQATVFECQDAAGRSHKISVDILTQKCSVTWCPVPFVPGKTLRETIDRFEKQVSRFVPLWDELDEIDTRATVVDPPTPIMRSVLRRRLALWNLDGILMQNVFLEIYLAPDAPKSVPCAFSVIGPEKLTRHLRESISNYNWTPEKSVFENLKAACSTVGAISTEHVRSPISGNSQQREDAVQECGVCYVYRLLDSANDKVELPDESCTKCARPFHRSCIVGWLRAVPSTKRSYKLMVGECPYCGDEITIKDD